MARSDLFDAGTLFASPDSASVVFGIDSFSNPRPKNLFYIRFKRPILSGGESWRKGHGFLAKGVDQPSVTPQTEELNQYGKKRIIHTGVKYNPINVTFYDTVDSAARKLWTEYAQYYFGDFNHATQTAWRDDITAATMVDPEKSGFGFQSRAADSTLNYGIDTQFFFESLEIFQVYGGSYIQTDIINPKITSVEFDGLDYEDASPSTVRMTFSYEAIIYQNGSTPVDISNDSGLSEAFKSGFSGDVFDPNLGIAYVRPFSSSTTTFSSFVNSTLKDVFTGTSLPTALLNSVKQTIVGASPIGGALSQFGSLSFGNSVTQILATTAIASVADTTARSANMGSTLFDASSGNTNSVVQAAEQLTTAAGTSQPTTLSEEAMGLLNTFSDGTVQVGVLSSVIPFV